MTLLNDVRPRVGVYYSDVNKDLEVQSMIDGALAYFEGAGWIISTLAPTPLAVEAVILYCKMAQSTDPSLLTNHPVLISFIAQGRAVVPVVEI